MTYGFTTHHNIDISLGHQATPRRRLFCLIAFYLSPVTLRTSNCSPPYATVGEALSTLIPHPPSSTYKSTLHRHPAHRTLALSHHTSRRGCLVSYPLLPPHSMFIPNDISPYPSHRLRPLLASSLVVVNRGRYSTCLLSSIDLVTCVLPLPFTLFTLVCDTCVVLFAVS